MKQIKQKQLPKEIIIKIKKSIEIDIKNKYKLMGLEFNLTDNELNEDISYNLSKYVFFYDPFFFRYSYGKLIDVNLNLNIQPQE